MGRQRKADRARERLVDMGGKTAQDLGFGRISGQVLVYLYLQEGEKSLDEIGSELGLSKAAVSIAARQLENLGLLRRIWKRGDRKNYYRTADNIGSAMRQGLLALLQQKIQTVAAELEDVDGMIAAGSAGTEEDPELLFIRKRVARARQLGSRASRLLRRPFLSLLTRGR